MKHLVTIYSDTIQGKRAILKWPKSRGVPDPRDPNKPWAKEITADGLLCEIDDVDLDEAKTLGRVTVIYTKP